MRQYLASLYFDGLDGNDGGERVFPVQNSGSTGEDGRPHVFNATQDGNGDGVVDPEDALQNILPYQIGTGLRGTGRTGLPDRGPNDQTPAVYVHRVALTGAWARWIVYQYWLYYADNDWLNHHEHDWEAYFVYLRDGEPTTVRLSFHGGFFAHDWRVFLDRGLVEDGTHLRLSVDRGSHAFLSPGAGLQDGVRLGYDGTVTARGGRLDAGDGGSFPFVLISDETSPLLYAYGDPLYLEGENDDLRPAPWAQPEWTAPPPPYGFYSGPGPTGPGAPLFSDVSPADARAEAIAGLQALGVLDGYPREGEIRFQPDAPLLRAQLAKMVCRLLGLPPGDTSAPFSDLGPDDPSDPYPHQYIAAAARAGLFMGTGSGRFAPYAPVTQRQLALIGERAIRSVHPTGGHSPLDFETAEQLWAPVTRGEAASFLWTLRRLLS